MTSQQFGYGALPDPPRVTLRVNLSGAVVALRSCPSRATAGIDRVRRENPACQWRGAGCYRIRRPMLYPIELRAQFGDTSVARPANAGLAAALLAE